ncbi:MAG: ABC transporter permease [Bulleidia sp.]|nr:ABC transporter permease [Bulleidia sp.]
MMFILKTTLELGILYSFISLALFISYRILDIADLTTDGSFVLSMAVSVALAYHGHPVLGIVLGMLAGGCAGLITAVLQTKFKVPSIIAGIITSTGLYTINLMVMGYASQISLLKQVTVFGLLRNLGFGGNWYVAIFGLILLMLVIVLLRMFLSTRLGLSLRATGDNPAMVTASSINANRMIVIGLVLANMLTGISGALIGQFNKSADINAGSGIVVVGLACLIIGESCMHGRRSITRNLLACFVGNIIYRLIYAIVLQTQFVNVQSLRLVTALIVAIAVAMPTIQENYRQRRMLRKETLC